MIMSILRGEDFDFNFMINANTKLVEKQLRTRVNNSTVAAEEIKRHAIFAVQRLFETLPLQHYIPVFGRFEYPVKVADSVVHVGCAALLLSKEKKRLHAVSFSPYSSPFDMKNDLVQVIKSMTLANATPVPHREQRAYLHLANIGTTGQIHYTFIECTDSTVKESADHIQQPIKLIEAGYHYPVVPCAYECEFRSQCRAFKEQQ